MNNLGRNITQMSISIPPDEKGFTGRECPVPECLGYFKVKFGTGLKGKDVPCHCPYCGHIDSHNKFYTKEQIEYAKSVALNRITGAFIKDLKALEFNSRPQGGFGIGISMKIEGQPHPIRYYRERQLETEVVCETCTLQYMIYGVFGFCPDCGIHNSLQILNKNLDVIQKMLAVANVQEPSIAEVLIANALEDCVSAFDGFGRELCRVYAEKTSDPARAGKVSFQNLEGAKQNLQVLFNFDLAVGLTIEEWKMAVRGFQKRHLLSHKMGVVDEDYVDRTGDVRAVVGRKVRIGADEVRELVRIVDKLGRYLSQKLGGI